MKVLPKPYTDKQKTDFIILYGQDCNNKIGHSMAIQESDKALWALEPWETLKGNTVFNHKEEYDAQQFEIKKAEKYQENDLKSDLARYNQEFTITIQDKECIFDTSSKTQKDLLTAFAVCSTGSTYDGWITNNGVELDLTLEDVATISVTFKELSNVYPKWKEFKEQIDNAVTIAELESIVIDYDEEVELDNTL